MKIFSALKFFSYTIITVKFDMNIYTNHTYNCGYMILFMYVYNQGIILVQCI